MDMSLSKLWETEKDREAWRGAVHGVTKSRTWLSDRTIKWNKMHPLDWCSCADSQSRLCSGVKLDPWLLLASHTADFGWSCGGNFPANWWYPPQVPVSHLASLKPWELPSRTWDQLTLSRGSPLSCGWGVEVSRFFSQPLIHWNWLSLAAEKVRHEIGHLYPCWKLAQSLFFFFNCFSSLLCFSLPNSPLASWATWHSNPCLTFWSQGNPS